MTVFPLFRRSLAAALCATALAGCSTDMLDVIVLSARAPGPQCDFKDDTLYVEGGSVDFRPYALAGGGTGVTASFGQVFSWESNMLATPLVVNGQVVDQASGNEFIADQAVMSYQYSDPSVTIPAETQNLHAVIPAGCSRVDCSVGIDLIGAGAAQILLNTLDATPRTLLVTFQFTGKTAAGRTTHTNDVSFPLTVYRSDTTPLTCPANFILDQRVCGSAGRDAPVQCIPNN